MTIIERGASSTTTALEALVCGVERETGLCFPEAHHDTILKAAAEHCRQLNLDPQAFAGILSADSEAKSRFLDDIMIGETYFFRDEKHFAALRSFVFPRIMQRTNRVAIWSVTCSSGEEALSVLAVAMQVSETLGVKADIELLATDINRKGLECLRRGRYGFGSFRNDGKVWHPLLDKLGDREGDDWVCRPEILQKLRISQLNIVQDPLPSGKFDLIFFRNTLLYMKSAQKDKVIDRLVTALNPGGFLFLASPEIPTVRHKGLRVIEREGSFFFEKHTDTPVEAGRASASGQSGTRHTARPVRSGTASATDQDKKDPVRSATRAGRAERGQKLPVTIQDLREGLELASRRQMADTSGGADATGGNAEYVAAQLLETVGCIQKNRFTQALKHLEDFEQHAGENFISTYLHGVLSKHQGRSGEAVGFWEKSRLLEGGFWPAVFSLAAELRLREPERTRSLLLECRKLLEGSKGKDTYLVLLDGFDTEYYRHMTLRMLEQLG